jgi:hypothetical protein
MLIKHRSDITSSEITLIFNGYAEQVQSMYAGMNLRRDF